VKLLSRLNVDLLARVMIAGSLAFLTYVFSI